MAVKINKTGDQMNYYAVERSTDHLAHYGVKGMRWGVRRAIATGNERMLDKHYRKAARKLAKLQRIGDHPGLSKAKAAAYGAAAAGTASVVIGGTKAISGGMRIGRKGIRFAGSLATGKTVRPLSSIEKAATAVDKWGNRHDIGKGLSDVQRRFAKAAEKDQTIASIGQRARLRRTTNSDYIRLGAAAATAGLAARAAHHAYRAKNAEKYREKAEEWKNAMDDVFSDTRYADQYAKLSKRQQKRYRRGY